MKGAAAVISAMVVAAVLAVAAPLGAQTVRSGTIGGTVADESRAAIPGVTVTLTSPALQVPQIVKVTDGSGAYQFVDLPLGTYRVSFELQGFGKLVRESIELSTGFAARVDAVLKVSGLEETVTVSGQSPMVDVTNTRGGATLSNDLLESIPNNRTYTDIGTLTPGMMPGVPPQTGGIGFGAIATTAAGGGYRSYGFTGGERVFMDGVNMQSNEAPDFAISEEVDVKTFGATAETPTPGAQIQIIVKSGGNDFHGRFKEEYITDALSSSNVDAALRAQGISAGDALVYSHDFIGDLGGRIVRDQLWFYGALRNQRNAKTIAGYAQDPGPDGQYGTGDDVLGRPPAENAEYTGKLSYQPSATHRYVGLFNRGQAEDDESFGSRFIPKESTEHLFYPNYRTKGEWQGTLTDRLLADVTVGGSWYYADYFTPESSLLKPSTLDRATLIQTGTSFDTSRSGIHRAVHNTQFAGTLTHFAAGNASGSHELKAGYAVWWEATRTVSPSNPAGNYQLVFDTVGGLPHQPVQLNGWTRPTDSSSRLNYYATFLADTWRITNRLTANLGLRWERNVSFVPPSVKEQGPFGDAGSFPQIEAGTWTDVAPRAGFAFDLTGDGKTVVKGTYGLYYHDFGPGFASGYSTNTQQTIAYRWHDLNSDRLYQPGEINLNTNGPDFISIAGGANPIKNPDLKQPRTHQVSASFERELVGNLSVRALYVYFRSTDLFSTINPLRPYGAFNIPLARQDPGPDGNVGTADDGGSVTIFDYDPAFRGGAFTASQPANRPAGHDDYANSFELLLDKRSGKVSGNTSILMTKNHRWINGNPQSPNDLFFPLDETWEVNFRVAGSYAAPHGIRLSALFYVLNGVPGQRTYLFRNLPQLSTLTVPLEQFGSQSGPIRTNLNIHVGRRFAFGKRRIEPSIDALNATNNNQAWTTGYAAGPTFGYATKIAAPRALRLGLQFDF
jgi:hypothetical protein